MKVYLYSGMQKLIEKSGVGRAIYHQEKALIDSGIEYSKVKSKDYELVHINTIFPSSLFLALKSKRQGIPVVYHAHSTQEDFCNSYIGSNLVAPIFKRWIKFCYETGDVIITPTEYSKQLLLSYGINNPIFSISNGIDTQYYQKNNQDRVEFREKYGFDKNEKVIMSVGLWIERKGILDFVKIAAKMPNYKFIWFGYSDPKTLPHKIRKALKTKLPNLIFAGYVNKEELKKAYSGSDLFLFMSHEETEGIVVLEALSMKIPSIVRGIPVYDGWLINGKNIYKADKHQEFENVIDKVLKGELQDLTECGRKTAEERDIKIVGKQLTSLYISTYNEMNFKNNKPLTFVV